MESYRGHGLMKPLIDSQERNWKDLWHYRSAYNGYTTPNVAALTENGQVWIPNPFGSDIFPYLGTWVRSKTFGFSAAGRFFMTNDGFTQVLNGVHDLDNGGALIVKGHTTDDAGDGVYEFGSLRQHFRNNSDSLETSGLVCGLPWRWDVVTGSERIFCYAQETFNDPSGGFYQYEYNAANNRFECIFGAGPSGRRDNLAIDRGSSPANGDVDDVFHFSLTPDFVAVSGSLTTGSGPSPSQSAHIHVLDRSTDPWTKLREFYRKDDTPSHFHRASTTNSKSKFVAEFSPDYNWMAVACRGGGYDFYSIPPYPYVIDVWDASDPDPNNWTIAWQLSDTVYAQYEFWRLHWSPDSRWLCMTRSDNSLGINEGGIHIFDRDNSWAEIPALSSPFTNDYVYSHRAPQFDANSEFMVCGYYSVSSTNGAPRMYIVNPTLGGAWSYINPPPYYNGVTANNRRGIDTFIHPLAKRKF